MSASQKHKEAEAYAATRWLVPVYFCEFGFLLHTPILLVAPPVWLKSDSSKPSWTQRFRIAMTKIFDRKERRRYLLQQRNANRIYGGFEAVHHIIFVVRMVLNLVASGLILSGAESVTSEEGRIAQNVFYSLTATPNAIIGWRVFIASFVLLVMAYAHHRYFLMHEILHATEDQAVAAKIKPTIFQLCHVSIINFALDIPGVGVKPLRVNRYIGLILNLVSVLLLLLVVEQRPLEVQSAVCSPLFNLTLAPIRKTEN